MSAHDGTITKERGEALLLEHLKSFERAVDSYTRDDVNQGQFDALVDFAYNAGVGALAKSTLLKRVNEERFDDVPAEFMKWTKGGGKVLPGLVKRREAEKALFLS